MFMATGVSPSVCLRSLWLPLDIHHPLERGGRSGLLRLLPELGRRHSKEETLLTVSFLGQQPHICDKVHVFHMELLWGNSRVPFGPKKSQG